MTPLNKFIFRVVVLLGLSFGGDAQAGSEERAAKLSQRAVVALVEESDPRKALDLATKALKKNPDDPDALGVTCVVLIGASMGAPPEQKAQLLMTAAEMLQYLRETSPTSDWLEVVGTLYTQAIGAGMSNLIEGPPVSCSAEASSAYNSAEERFSRGEYVQAKAFYERAVALCPENPLYQTMYGDAFFMMGDLPAARAQYDAAIALDPHDWTALRFRADAYIKEGDLTRGRVDAIASVAANPTYAFGWSYLEGLQLNTGGSFNHVRVQKPARVDPKSGSPVISGDNLGVINYQMSLLVAERVRSDPSAPLDPMELERMAVRMTIQSLVATDPGALDKPENTLWRLLSEADAAGYLDEAIFVLWLDESIVPAFLAHRDAHRDRIEAYIGLYLVPAKTTP
ncbi:tetratricopeptide repeat protein [Myxococcota bacterium]|nr:tetratricopeptide repeat protein [Myxococcota bacterium]